jgi:hypothetical protein
VPPDTEHLIGKYGTSRSAESYDATCCSARRDWRQSEPKN